MNNLPVGTDKLTRYSLFTIALCLAIQTIGNVFGSSPAIAQSQGQRQSMDVYIKGVDIPHTQNLTRLFNNVQVDCNVRNWLDMPLRVKPVDDDMTPRQPKE